MRHIDHLRNTINPLLTRYVVTKSYGAAITLTSLAAQLFGRSRIRTEQEILLRIIDQVFLQKHDEVQKLQVQWCEYRHGKLSKRAVPVLRVA